MRLITKIPVGLASFFLALYCAAQQSLEAGFHVGPLYHDAPGQASVVVELPYGITQPAAENFHILMDEKPELTYSARQVKNFRDSGQELALLLCIDVSGTMAGAPLTRIKDDLLAFVAKRQQMRFAVMSFGSEIKHIVGFNNDLEGLTAAVTALKAGGAKSKTKLYDALYSALDYYETEKKTAALPARMRVLVVSDGKAEGNHASSDSVKMRSAALGIPIDAVGFGKIDYQYVESLRGLAEGTGGRFVHVQPGLVSLKDALIRIHRELTETQTIVAYFQGLPKTGERFTDTIGIQLKLPDGRSLARTLNARLPLPLPPPEPDGRGVLWVLVALLTLLCLTAAIVYLRRRKEEEPSTPPPRPKTVAAPPDVLIVAGTPKRTSYQIDPPTPDRRTRVSGYFPGPRPGRPAAILVGISGSVKGRKYGVERELFRLGVSCDNDVVLGDDEYVSSHHAQVRYEKGFLLLADQGSRNGTFLNDQRVGEVPLVVSPGDHIRVGDSTFEVMAAPGR
jgi:hypothetical protein